MKHFMLPISLYLAFHITIKLLVVFFILNDIFCKRKHYSAEKLANSAHMVNNRKHRTERTKNIE